MKKQLLILFVFACAMLISAHSYGQFRLGVKAGYNSSSLGGLKDMSNVKEAKSLSGYHAGFFGQFKITIITLQVDAVYSTQGAKWTDSGNAEHTYENNYLNIPVVAKLKLGPIAFLGGVQYGFLIDSAIDGVADDDGRFKNDDFSIPVGVAFNLSRLMLEARYNVGVSNVNNLPDELKNGVIQLSAGFKFGK